MNIELENFDKQRIEKIQKLIVELYEEDVGISDWAVVSSALRIYESELKQELKKKRGETE